MLGKISKFLGEVKVELKKTSWLTRIELRDTTVVVIVAIFILAIYVGVIDMLLSKVVSLLIR